MVQPRVFKASLPPVVLPCGRLECQACGLSFVSWENYYGHIMRKGEKVCAWIHIDHMDLVPSPDDDKPPLRLFDDRP